MLAWQRLYIYLFEHPHEGFKNVTFETNTTQHPKEDFLHHPNTQNRFAVYGSCSPKLAVSGELGILLFCPVWLVHSSVNGSDIYPKFVVFTNDDFDEVTRAVEAYKEARVECPVHSMPWADVPKNIIPNVKEVQACMERGWRFHPDSTLISKCLGNLK